MSTTNSSSSSFAPSLREIDIELMRRLSPRVNVIPVVGRADSLIPQELKDFKRRASRPGCEEKDDTD
jgi:septin family protein